MSRKVFISFRFNDGYTYKEILEKLFSESEHIIDCSEDKDRSQMSDDTIKEYLYKKLRTTSVTVFIVTPESLTYHTAYKNGKLVYDDWLYDELRYSLEDREENRSNGLIAVYTPEVESMILKNKMHNCSCCGKGYKIIEVNDLQNLFRKNMFNVKSSYKSNHCENVYDFEADCYCTFVSWKKFMNDFEGYIERAANKRERIHCYEICKKIDL